MHQHANYLEIQSFGTITLRWHTSGERLSVAPREEALIIYLAHRGAPVTREELCDFFWPNDSTTRARGNLRKLLTDVRKSADSIVQSDRELVWLTDTPYWFDVHQFQQLTQSLALAPNDTKPFTDADIVKLQEGLRIYHGDFMARFKTPQSSHFAAWLDQEQRVLQQRAIATCSTLLDHATRQMQLARATAYARRLLEIDPYHEEAHGQLMRLLAHQSQAADAVAHYEQYVAKMNSEMDVVVEIELAELYQQIRAGILPPLHTNTAPPITVQQQNRALTARPLPTPVTPLIGRIELLHGLAGYLQNPATRLITLVGLGGVGKSRMALALAERLQGDYHNAVAYIASEQWLAPLNHEAIAAEQSYQLLAQASAEALGLSCDATDLQLDQLVSKYVQQQRFILFFDNFENVIEGAPFLLKLLQEAPALKIVVTSRELLQIPGEVVVNVEGLPWSYESGQEATITTTKVHPEADDIRLGDGWQMDECVRGAMQPSQNPSGGFARSLPPAIELFLNLAQRHQPHLTFTAAQLEQIGQICALVDGNPLAIELAAGLVAHYSYDELIALLGSSLQSLQTKGRGRIHRHRSIHEVLEDSWQLLSKPEQKALTQLSLLPRHFHRAKAIQIDGISPNILIDLTAKSMLRPIGQGSYQLPNLVQLFANQKRQQSSGARLHGG